MFGLIITGILLISLAKKHTFPQCMNSHQVSDKTNIKRRFKTFTELPLFRICKMSLLGHLWLLAYVSQLGKRQPANMDSLQIPAGICWLDVVSLRFTKPTMPDGRCGFTVNALFTLTKTSSSTQSYNFPGVFSCMQRMAAAGLGVETPSGCLGYLHKAWQKWRTASKTKAASWIASS